MSMGFLTGIAAAQHAAAGTKPADHRRRRVLSIVGGVALALLIGGALFVAALLTS